MRGVVLSLLLLLPGCTRANLVARDAGPAQRPDAGVVDASAEDAGRDAGGVPDGSCAYEALDRGGEPSGCVLTTRPPRPLCEDEEDIGDVYFVARNYDLSPSSAVGIDLDGHCTGDTAGPANCEPRTMHPLDGPGGIDNAFASSFGFSLRTLYASSFGTTFDDDVALSSDDGRGSLTLRIRGWNGLADDRNVTVAAAITACVRGGGATDGCPPESEVIDWTQDDNVLLPAASGFRGENPEQAVFEDRAAYVSRGRLVVRLAERTRLDLPTPNGTIRIGLRGGFVVATLSADRRRITEGFISAKWEQDELELAAQAFNLCPDDTLEYGLFVNALTEALDVRADDFGGEGVPCDALSLTLSFDGERVEWGPLQTIEAPENPCAPP